MEPLRVVLVPHTHWDREWYLSFEAFLERLVAMMDGLIELLDRDPRFAHFHLDGQAAMVDDYLAVRPEREADVRRLAREGRISVGPWFTQMDEFLISGESLVRNLEWGLRRARELGADPRTGYLPDQFGHVGQMPQLLRRAGIGRAVVWRGVPSAVDRTAFWWEAPDGSRVLAEYLAFGYGLGYPVGQARSVEEFVGAVRRAAEVLAPHSPRDRLLVPVGADHFGPPAHLPDLLEGARRDGTDGLQVEMGSVDGYLDGPEPPDLPVWRGELRSSARAHLLPGVYSARVHQKRDRARAEAVLERYAEPLAALVPGFPWPEEELREAWRLLLWNGAHDSVCGCSVDEVARAVDARTARARARAEAVALRALRALGELVGPAGRVRFNPSPFEREGVPGLGWRVEPGPGPEGAEEGAWPGRPWPVGEPVALEVRGDRVLVAGLGLRLLDEPDVGDLYNFCPAEGATPSPPERVEVRGGEAVATFPGLAVRLWALRSPEDPFIRLEGVVRNERPDHRLRLYVELPQPAAGSVAGSPFELVERPLRSEGGTELPSPTWPARGVVLSGGVAVLAEGVFEYEVAEEPPALAVTLLRCVGTISRPSLATRPWPAGPDVPTPQAQMVGETAFSLGLLPGARREELLPAWERFALPLLEAPARGGGHLPPVGRLLEVAGAELSAVRRVDGELEVRVWNSDLRPREARVGGRALALRGAEVRDVRLPG
ncbi:MAG TPA: hypothetical protein VNO34_11020 [Actinomycetota bacterium]|nr:hypothetical protein [Actinomycetota bacterium]